MEHGKRLFWLIVGLIAVALAAAGALLPLLPTTPFLLVAAYAFARSSPRLHNWLTGHRIFGPMIVAWQEKGAIPRRAKRIAVATMVGVWLLSVAMQAPLYILVIQAVVLTASGAFILTRPDAEQA